MFYCFLNLAIANLCSAELEDIIKCFASNFKVFLKLLLPAKSIFFLMILMFISISPIEEVNAFYGLILGLLYRPLFKEDYESL